MTDKEKFIKWAFKNYTLNRKRLKEQSFDSIHAVDYSKIRVKETRVSLENSLVTYLDNKAKLSKAVELVDRVLWYYKLDGSPKYDFIKARFEKGFSNLRACLDCYVSESTGKAWLKEIYKRGIAVADLFDLWCIYET